MSDSGVEPSPIEDVPVAEMRRILVVAEKYDRHGIGGKTEEFVVEIPSEWKVTFGVATGRGGEVTGRDLRFYEGTSARGVFTGVVQFRDLVTMKVFRKNTKVVADSHDETDNTSSKSNSEISASSEWVPEVI